MGKWGFHSCSCQASRHSVWRQANEGAGWQRRHRAQRVLRGGGWQFQPQSLAVNWSQTHGKVHPLTPSSSQLPQEVAENSSA